MELLDRLKEAFANPAGQHHLLNIERQHQAQVLETRRAQHQQLGVLEAQLATEAPRLRDRVIDREAAVTEARRALSAAETARDLAQAEYVDGTVVIEAQINRLRARLVASASPLIAAFLWQLFQIEDSTRRPESLIMLAHQNQLTGKHTLASNAASLEARMRAIRGARHAADALKLEALTESEIEQHLAALLDGIPAIEGVEVPA